MARINLSLQENAWPRADVARWREGFLFIDKFADTPAATLSQSSSSQMHNTYGIWMYYILSVANDLKDLSPADRFTADSVREFCSYLSQGCSYATIAKYVFELTQTMRILEPKADWMWLYLIASRLKAKAEKREKPEVLSPQLYALGLRLMDSSLPDLRSSRLRHGKTIRKFRDGLIIASMTEAPIRSGAFRQLNLDQHLRRSGDSWLIEVPREFTKTDYPQNYELTQRLSAYMDFYVSTVRACFTGASSSSALWVTDRGRLSGHGLLALFRKRTTYSLGISVNPHAVRNAAATYLCRADAENAFAARDLLGHSSFSMTMQYIEGARTRAAGRRVSSLMVKRRDALRT